MTSGMDNEIGEFNRKEQAKEDAAKKTEQEPEK